MAIHVRFADGQVRRAKDVPQESRITDSDRAFGAFAVANLRGIFVAIMELQIADTNKGMRRQEQKLEAGTITPPTAQFRDIGGVM
ncbi:MAG: hypothetical protein MJE12_05235 [Alphaproteobacteria bacterium]|nr:hypothetical protein [Alphaproteobacteria bacterium]